MNASDVISHALRENPWFWASELGLRVMGVPYRTENYEFQIGPMMSTARRRCAKKATQALGWTQLEILRILHGMRYGRYRQGVLYLFPTAQEVSAFSSSRFKPMIRDNPEHIGRYIRDTDSANVKRINDAFLYFRGARMTQEIDGKKTSSSLKALPVDEFVMDEFDEMPAEAVTFARGRLEASDIRAETYLANPTIPGWGIDKLYQESDQRVWMIKCSKCGGETCLELEFPDCLHRRRDGSVVRMCMRCRDRAINPRNGRWVALYPEKSKDFEGYWGSHLMAARSDMTELLDQFEDPKADLSNLYNLRLGMAHISKENQLSQSDVFRHCGIDAMAMRHAGPCALGCDVGKTMHPVIVCRPNSEQLKIVKLAEVSGFDDVHDLCQRFNVRCAVFDLNPETRKVREFAKSHGFPVFGCYYNPNQRTNPAFDSKNNTVSINRTELLDTTHDLIMGAGRLDSIPRRCPEVEEYARQMTMTVKVLGIDDDGKKTYKYKKLGADHFYHSTGYALLASIHIGVCDNEEGVIRSDAWVIADDADCDDWMSL